MIKLINGQNAFFRNNLVLNKQKNIAFKSNSEENSNTNTNTSYINDSIKKGGVLGLVIGIIGGSGLAYALKEKKMPALIVGCTSVITTLLGAVSAKINAMKNINDANKN